MWVGINVSKYNKRISEKVAELLNEISNIRFEIMKEIGIADPLLAKTLMCEIVLLVIKAIAETVVERENLMMIQMALNAIAEKKEESEAN